MPGHGPACTDGRQLWTALTAALRVFVQDELLHSVHGLLPSEGRPHQHLHLVLLHLGGPAGHQTVLAGALTLAPGNIYQFPFF